MEFFIDTGDVESIKKLHHMGLVDGVTTNPSLVKKAKKNHETLIKEISEIVDGPISVETLGTDAKTMLKEAQTYLKWVSPGKKKNIVIKIVMTAEGMIAVRKLSEQGIKTNVTVTFSPLQALIAAKAGATYISPFVGRMDDISHFGMNIIEQIRNIYNNYNFKTKILTASVRNPLHVLESALIGVDAVTVPPKILEKLFYHPLTEIGIKKFLADSKEWNH